MIGFIWTLYIHTSRDYSTIADLHNLQFTVPQALRFSVFTSRIPAMDLSLSHSYFKSHMKSSFHCLIPLLPLFCSCQFQTFDSIKFLCPQVHIPAGWRTETRLFTLDYSSILPNTYLQPLCTDHAENTASIVKKVYLLVPCLAIDVLFLGGNVFTESLPRKLLYTSHVLFKVTF
jgi:hypothetical protein